MTIPFTFTHCYSGVKDGVRFNCYEMSHGMGIEISEYRKKSEIKKWLRTKRKQFVAVKRMAPGFEVLLDNGRKIVLVEKS